MAAIKFENIDDPDAARRKSPPYVIVGPRGEVVEVRGELDSEGYGGDLIGTWREGQFVIPKRHREAHFEIVDGETVQMGWISYEDMCRDGSNLARHGLSLSESLAYFKKHTKLLALRDRGSEVHDAVDWKAETWHHPEVYRRKKLPKLAGRALTPEDLAKELGEGEEVGAEQESLDDLRVRAKTQGFKNTGNMGRAKLEELLA